MAEGNGVELMALNTVKTGCEQRPGVKYNDYSEVKTRCKQRPGVNRKITVK